MTLTALLSYLRANRVHVWVDGPKLRYEAPARVMTAEIIAELRARKEELMALLRQVLEEASSPPAPLAPAPRHGPIPLSFSQQRLWFYEQLQPGTTAYNMPKAFRLDGPIDVAALGKCVTEILRRHESLRTGFVTEDSQHPRQEVLPASEAQVPVLERSHLTEEDWAQEVSRAAAGRFAEPFDLATGPCLRVELVRRGPRHHLLLLDMHHIASDGWSWRVFYRELSVLYAAAKRREPSPLPALAIQYPDYACWQRQQFQGPRLLRHVGYWKTQLGGAPELLALPTDFPRPAAQSHRGAQVRLSLAPKLTRELEELSRRESATLFMTLLTAFNIILERWSGQDDIVVGSPIAGRSQVETEPMIGFFINTLPLRTSLAGNPSFRELLHRVRQTTLGAYEHQAVPFDKLVEELRPRRSLGQTPLFQVMLNLLNGIDDPLELTGVIVERLVGAEEVESKFDLTLYVREAGETLDLELVYCADLFSAERMVEFARQFRMVLEQAVASPGAKIADYSLVTPEAAILLPDLTAPLPAAWYGAVTERFSHQAAQHPESSAVVEAGRTWTYGELERQSNQLARWLVASGMGPEDIVALYGPRSGALICSMLGVLKAGAGFMVLDPAYPAAVLRDRIELADPKAWVSVDGSEEQSVELASTIRAHSWRCKLELMAGFRKGGVLDSLPGQPVDVRIEPDSLAYIQFTSGSTGKPKAVMGTHRPLSQFFEWHSRTFGFRREDRFSMVSGLSHDPVLRDVFAPLWNGAAVCVPGTDDIGLRLAPWLRAEDVSVCHLTPAMIQLLDDTSADIGPMELKSLRYAFCGGDVLTRAEVAQLKALAPAVSCVNFYGATETPQAVGYYVVPWPQPPVGWGSGSAASARAPIPVGRGREGVQLVLLVDGKRPAGLGEVAEICVRTPYLARGYLGDDALSQARFVANPSRDEPSDRIYRTGDLGRYLPDGQVMNLGRMDSQVKIRGFRIELGEIETALGQHPSVRDVVVVAREDQPGQKGLVGYIVPQPGKSVAPLELRAFLTLRLPDYMVPAAIVSLAAMPLTPNGKVDRKALPAPGKRAVVAGDTGPGEPPTATEAAVASLWSDILKIGCVGVSDNFFALGGHSLLATQLIGRLNKIFQVSMPLRHLFEHPTVSGLSRALLKLETSPGRIERIAGLLQRIEGMSASERQERLQTKQF